MTIECKERILKEGDIISVDVCIREAGFIGDNCRTIPVRKCRAPEVENLLRVAEGIPFLWNSASRSQKSCLEMSLLLCKSMLRAQVLR